MNQDNTAATPLQAPPLSKTDILRLLSILGGGGVVIIILCGIVYLSEEDQYNAGWIVGYYGSIALWLGLIYTTLIFYCLISPVSARRAFVAIKSAFPSLSSGERQQELPAGLSIAPDLLIRFEASTDTPAMFAAKGFAFLHTKEQKDWALAVAWKERKAMILRNDSTVFEYFRNTPPWKKPEDWTDFHNYENETWAEYDAAIEQDKRGWLAWVVGAKTEHAQGIQKGATFFEAFARATTVLAFLLFAAQAYAQPKSAQIAAYVGAHNFQNARVTGAVVFEFAKLPITRNANAQTLAQILTDARSYNDEDNAGKLQRITLNGKPIPRFAPEVAELPDLEKSTRADLAKFIRPHQAPAMRSSMNTDTTPIQWDSTAIAETGNRARVAITESKGKLWGLAMSAWDTLLWAVETFFYALIWIAGLSRFTAVACNNETRITAWGASVYGDWIRGVGGFATVLTFFTALGLMLVFLTAFFIRAVTGQLMGLIALFLADPRAYFTYGWLFVLWLAIKAIDKWVPNPKIIGHRGNNGPGLNRG
jgi:hypothetical protein